MRILFVGETWNGSSARSLREALAPLPGVEMDDLSEDHYFARGRSNLLRVTNRLLRPWQRRELERDLHRKMDGFRPDVLMVYKGSGVTSAVVRDAKRAGVFTVNVFPDYSPHAYGPGLKAAIGEYDLVVSTKPFHPNVWKSTYGYTNRCVCVPHGYDPAVHYWPDPPGDQDVDVVLAATWRPQYSALMQEVARGLEGTGVRVAILGGGWHEHAGQLPASWDLAPRVTGRAYGEWLRRGRIVIAPVHRHVVIDGLTQPGDEDTTRTYELAAMGSFFLHCRTPYVRTIYDEATEVPMWDDAQELVALVRKYLPTEDARRAMAARAHARAVPAYSVPSRAREVVEHVQAALNDRSRAYTLGTYASLASNRQEGVVNE